MLKFGRGELLEWGGKWKWVCYHWKDGPGEREYRERKKNKEKK